MDTQQFEAELKTHTNPVVVDFWAAWCGPCKMISPILRKLAKEYQGQVDFLEVDADQSQDLLRSLGIMAIPTLIVYRNGQQVLRQTGARSEADYRSMFAQLASGEAPRPAAMSAFDRIFRLLAGAALGWLGFQNGLWLLVALGALVMFTGVYDRCPIWQALTGWWKKRGAQSS
ncbi:MAG: thioredoxin [Chloroflexota bacterium]